VPSVGGLRRKRSSCPVSGSMNGILKSAVNERQAMGCFADHLDRMFCQ
jgi:hypothetical protein